VIAALPSFGAQQRLHFLLKAFVNRDAAHTVI